MKRTATRPLPAGRMDRQTALHFGVGLGVFSVLLMGLATNWLAAAMLAVSILYYVLVYTIWLKRRTPQNIVIGGAAGAFPPLIGWVAATGDVTLLPVLLFAIIFLWTPPHFWALSLFVRSDYAKAGMPMLPVVAGESGDPAPDPDLHRAAGGGRVAPWWIGWPGAIYGIAAVLSLASSAGAAGLATARPSGGDEARKSGCSPISILYLFALFAALVPTGCWRMTDNPDEERDPRRQRGARIALALVLGGFVVLFYVITIVKMGGAMTALARPQRREPPRSPRCSRWRCSASAMPRSRSTACSAG